MYSAYEEKNIDNYIQIIKDNSKMVEDTIKNRLLPPTQPIQPLLENKPAQ